MQDIIARALALRNNGSSSGASAELAQKVQKIEDEYVRATDEKDIEEISSSIEAIKQEIEDKGAEVKASLDSNSAIKAIRPLSEIANYGAEYTYEDKSYGKFETVKITADTKSDDIIFVTKEGTDTITFQFWDTNGRQSVYGGACDGRNFVTVFNTGSQIDVFISTIGMKAFRYNSDGTFKNLYDGTFVQNDTVLTKYNTAAYTPTKDYHPATKKYVDDAIPTSLKNPFPLTFTGAASAIYDGSQAVTVDLPSEGTSAAKWAKVHEEILSEDVQSYSYALSNVKTAAIVFFPRKAFSGWSYVTVNNTNFPIQNANVQNFEAVYAIVSVNEVLKLTAGKACIDGPAIQGAAASTFLPLLDVAGITSIDKIGTITTALLTVGTKIIIYVKP